ncbi:hypothetical protein OSB04_un000852 [Centaurea solstitialis]|uniref:Reverse transcriptase Ty1/copia-type domain-containing protein n=1 Tax=Centaurea solstitialis TaxID=347529 RepID=A0AA38SBT0_9ASTR|nr:hypothetical protein OSB04_un000852 [Centaurea solstitialis]
MLNTYGVDYSEHSSPFAKLFIGFHLFSSAGCYLHWPLHQLDVKNAFCTVYLEQPPVLLLQRECLKSEVLRSLCMLPHIPGLLRVHMITRILASSESDLMAGDEMESRYWERISCVSISTKDLGPLTYSWIEVLITREFGYLNAKYFYTFLHESV